MAERSPKVRKKSAVGGPTPESMPATDRPASAKPLTIDHLPVTNKMEVHHHPDLHHKPKPWKEYLLEYLMIFLAVMTGFFAESFREHLGDKSKE
ncbi:MAG TPA: hypothetical protein VJ844_00005, partial [Mucilaginibacter sp.]|nr:hypothetical protein [Mucilaginibacter sp.]